MIIKRGKWLLLLSLVLLLTGLLWWLPQHESIKNDIFLQVSYGGTEQDIRCFVEEEDGTVCFFLPSGVEQIIWRMDKHADFWLDGEKIGDGMECRFESGKSYRLTRKAGLFGRAVENELVILQSENLASAYVVTDSGKMDYIQEEKGNKEGGTLCLVTADGQVDYTGAFAEIKGRGNYTWLLDKKSYSLNFDQDTALLGLAEDSQWVLLAGASEETHLINRMVFEMMRSVGIADVQNSTWIDLYLNGEYAGNYLLSQKVKPQEQDLNGGWMVEFDGYWEEEGKPGFYTEAGEVLAIGYPAKEQEGASEEKNQEIRSFIQRVENAVLSENGTDEESGLSWQELVDVDSLVKKYVLDEISKCPDGWNGSNYCFYRDGKLYFGAPWDYEFSFGNQPSWFSGLMLPQGLYHVYETQWYKALCKKPEFMDAVKAQYRDFFEPYLRKQAQETLDEQADLIRASMTMDALRWGGTEKQFDQKLQNLKNFISDRLDWLNQEWLGIDMEEETPWYGLYLMDNDSEYSVCYYRKGSAIDPDVLKREDESFTGWYLDEACTVPAQLPAVMEQDITLYSGWNPAVTRIRMFISLLPLPVLTGVLLLWIIHSAAAYYKEYKK